MNRRGFLAACLAAGAAPAFVRAESLMRIVVPSVEETLTIGWRFQGDPVAFDGTSDWVKFDKPLMVAAAQTIIVKELLVYQESHDEPTRQKIIGYLRRENA